MPPPPPPPPKAKAKATPKAWANRPKVERRRTQDVLQEWRREARIGEGALTSSVDNVDWAAIESYVYVEGGSGGVILVRCAGEHSPLFCLKPQRLDAAAELFASLLADALAVPTARLRVVPKSDDKVDALVKARPAIEEHAVHLEMKLLRGTQFFGLVDYVKGPTMEEPCFFEALSSLSEEDIGKFWIAIGKLLAFDCIINNLDRLPMIWDNAGNPKNVMIEVHPSTQAVKVVGIDQAVRPITSNAGLDVYCQRLRDVVRTVLVDDHPWPENTFARLNALVQALSLGKVDVHAGHLRSGLRAGFLELEKRQRSGELAAKVAACQRDVAFAFRLDSDAEPLRNLRNLVMAAAEAVAAEVQQHHLAIPRQIVSQFKDKFASSVVPLELVAKVLHKLDATLTSWDVSHIVDSSGARVVGEEVDLGKLIPWIFEERGQL